jgi:tetratricopeptide (TPR) repeat protein
MGNLETGDSERRRALFERAIRELEGLLEIEPDYVPALHNLSYLHQGLGQPVEAALYMDRIASLRPYSYVWQARAARAAYDAGGEEEAARIAARSADLLVPSDYEIDPQAVLFMRMVPAYVAWQNDDVEGALREAQAVALDPSVPESAHRTRAKAVSDIYLALGRLSDAGALAAEMRPRFAFQTRAVILYTKHDASGLRDLLESGAPEERALVPSLLIQAGMLEETREVVGDLGPGTVTISGGQSLYSGLLALAEGRTEDAIPLLAFANDQPLMGSAPWRASAALARAYQANGQPALAIEILESATRRSRAPLARTSVIRIWLTNLEALADAYREAGRIDEARAVESELRALLRVADEDHPLVVKLRAR